MEIGIIIILIKEMHTEKLSMTKPIIFFLILFILYSCENNNLKGVSGWYMSNSQHFMFIGQINSLLYEYDNLYLHTNVTKSKITGKSSIDLTFSDDNIQYIKIRNGKVLFEYTNMIFALDSTKIIMVTPFDLCAVDIYINNKYDSITGVIYKFKSVNNPYNIYILESKSFKLNVEFNTGDRITIYEPVENEMNLFLAPSFFLNSPINLILNKNKILKINFLKQLQEKIKNIVSVEIEQCNFISN